MAVKFTVQITMPKTKQQIREARNYAKYTKEKFLEMAAGTNTLPALISIDPNYVAQFLTAAITNILDKLAPMKKQISRTQHAPHLTASTKEAMRARNILKNTANTTQLLEDRNTYKRKRNEVVRQIRKDKKQWLLEKVKGDVKNTKQLWNMVNSITGRKKFKQHS